MNTFPNTPNMSFKTLGLLLTCPGEPLLEALPELETTLENDPALPCWQRAGLAALFERLRAKPMLDLQEDYVALFDQTRSLSLNLFEHVHGDSKQRGQAMAELHDVYREHGVEIDSELPDYLPRFCGFLSMLPAIDAKAILAEASPALQLLHARLSCRPSVYAAVTSSLLALAGIEATETQEEDVSVASDDFEALDREWQESEITFGFADTMDSCKTRRPRERPARILVDATIRSKPPVDVHVNVSEGTSPC